VLGRPWNFGKSWQELRIRLSTHFKHSNVKSVFFHYRSLTAISDLSYAASRFLDIFKHSAGPSMELWKELARMKDSTEYTFQTQLCQICPPHYRPLPSVSDSGWFGYRFTPTDTEAY
jgi:hypothetical protein